MWYTLPFYGKIVYKSQTNSSYLLTAAVEWLILLLCKWEESTKVEIKRGTAKTLDRTLSTVNDIVWINIEK